MPLKLSLKPGETFIVNGAVVRNGERRGVLLLENRARVLREKDIMQPEEATTPASRAYFALMQMYLIGEGEGEAEAMEEVTASLASLMGQSPPGAPRETVLDISRLVACGDHYRALSHCRRMMAREMEGPT